MTRYNPNRKPFPRESFIQKAALHEKIHPFQRQAHQCYFKEKNPKGYQHDLGAQDVFLDNFGMFCDEQFDGNEPVKGQYFRAVRVLMERWMALGYSVLQRKPWWGTYFNDESRQANTGEPRSLVRLLGDHDWSHVRHEDLWPLTGLGPNEVALREGDLWDGRRLLRLRDYISRLAGDAVSPSELVTLLTRYDDWDERLLFPEREDQPSATEGRVTRRPGGLPLPIDHPKTVPSLRVLHPRESTPDLHMRVGARAEDRQAYRRIVRDQGILPTCTANAFAMALDLAAWRRYGRIPRFSSAWLHCASGEQRGTGRSLRACIDIVSRSLPCTERSFRYPQLEEQLAWMARNDEWRTAARVKDSETQRDQRGLPCTVQLRPDAISDIKTRLAAGWSVIVGTSLTEEMIGVNFDKFGMALSPLIGQTRLDTGHAWLLVGYDHTDGTKGWKYQGSFYALNSWGATFPASGAFGEGVCAIPFATLLTEGVEAYALRF